MKRVGVLGAGSWGTALSLLAAEKSESVVLHGRDAAAAAALEQTRENTRYLPGVRLPANVRVTSTLADLRECDAVLLVVPSKAMRDNAAALREVLRPGVPVITCSKGIERETGLRMSQIVQEAMPGHAVGVLSGPNHAEEVGRRQPTAAVIGAEDHDVAVRLQEILNTNWFRAYTSADVAGIEWAGAAKNVFALAAGIADGLKVGDNAKAALLTRGLAEMIRLGTAMGGRPETFQGLSGVGDLMATCYSDHSRNQRVGSRLGQGQKLAEVVASMNMVAEGVPNTESIYLAARKAGVRTPIIDTVYAILYADKPCALGMKELLSRDPRPEAD